MIIQIDGVNTRNKGAELMLCSVIKEIENRFPKSTVYVNLFEKSDLSFLKTNLNVKQRYINRFSRYFIKILRTLHCPYDYFTMGYVFKKVDILLDAGGFQFSDQFTKNWIHPEEKLKMDEKYYKKHYEFGTKIIFLPQAFGSFELKYSKQMIGILGKYSTKIIARESKSFSYLKDEGIKDNVLSICTDFTLNIKKEDEEIYSHLKNKVCIIPNKKMITHTSCTEDQYLFFLKTIIEKYISKGEKVFLLCHEGKGDLEILKKLNEELEFKLDIVSDLNAYQIKSIIGNSSFVVTSRYHGLASALNQSIPVLASSWSHKYKLLYADYGLDDMVINYDTEKQDLENKIERIIQDKDQIKSTLIQKKKENEIKVKEMWLEVWDTI